MVGGINLSFVRQYHPLLPVPPVREGDVSLFNFYLSDAFVKYFEKELLYHFGATNT